MTTTDAAGSLSGRLAGQGALLFAGFAGAQACSFLRNALLGHWLAKGDFGIAATLTLTLTLIEILSDLGADRLIVQDRDGEDERLMATAHVLLVARGLLLAIGLYAGAGAVAHFFGVPQAAWAFQAVALAPLLKGAMHLDLRRRQRRLDNRPYIAVEAVPQVLALAATPVALWLAPGYAAVVWLALGQAAAAVVLSHLLAERRYRLGVDREFALRLVSFGWPILLSAVPLVAVYHGDRAIVGRLLGIEQLANLTAAFMLTMVPGLLAAKVGPALMLPLLSEARTDPAALTARLRMMSALTAAWAAAYLAGFLVAGGAAVALAFGAEYRGLGLVTGWLALMWALRMMQAVPGMALMSRGETRPMLVAGCLRALALAPAAMMAVQGHGLAAIVAMGVVGEAASGAYLLWRTRAMAPGSVWAMALPALLVVPVGLVAAAVGLALAGQSALVQLVAGAALAAAGGLAVMAGVSETRRLLAGLIVRVAGSRRVQGAHAGNVSA